MGKVIGCSEMVVPGWHRGMAESAALTGEPNDDEGGQRIYGLDLGHGVFAAPYSRHGDDAGDHVGAFIWHTHEDGMLCGGGVRFVTSVDRPGGAVWDVVSWWPLTITPSVLCRGGPDGAECLHGFITDGRWVPC